MFWHQSFLQAMQTERADLETLQTIRFLNFMFIQFCIETQWIFLSNLRRLPLLQVVMLS